jgi:hypothetical protein
VDFKSVLVTDLLAWEIFGAAAVEKLLFVGDPRDQVPRKGAGLAAQRALSLIVLFDRLLIHDFGRGTFRLPDLEKEGIVEIIPADKVPTGIPALTTKRRPGKLGSRRRPPKTLLQSLSLVQQFRPLITNRLLTGRLEFFDFLAKSLGLSRRTMIDTFLDYAIAYAQGNENGVQEHIFNEVLPKDFVDEIRNELFDYSARGDLLGPTNVILVMATLFAQEIAIIKELSTKHEVGVATEHYGAAFRSEPAMRGKQLDAICAANRFLILRAAFADGAPSLPRIQGIKHALLLRKDPQLKAMREQLKVLHGGLNTGDRSAILEATREIQKSRRALKRRASWDKALAWLTYMSVPVGVAEVLMGSPPLIGTSVSIIGASGTATVRRIEKKNKWVLFGT